MESSPERDVLEEVLVAQRVARIDRTLGLRWGSIAVLLEDLHEPQNCSACLRTSEGLGIQDVHVIEGVEPFVPHRKITQGTDLWLTLHRHPDVASAVRVLRDDGWAIAVGDLQDGALPLEELAASLDPKSPICLAVGNEHRGITDVLRREADYRFVIPMYGMARSFNLSVALAMTLNTVCSARARAIGRWGDLDEVRRSALRRKWLGMHLRDPDATRRAYGER